MEEKKQQAENKPIAEEKGKNLGYFRNLRGKLDSFFGGDKKLTTALGGRPTGYAAQRLADKQSVEADLRNSLDDPRRAYEISRRLMDVSSVYSDIIGYYSNLPIYRYTVIPNLLKEKGDLSPEKYSKVYQEMLSVVDGLSIEITFPKLLELGMIEGAIFIYATRNTSAKTVSTFVLPREYCRIGFTTNFGTESVIFNFAFLEELLRKLSGSGSGYQFESEDDFFALFPPELVEGYKAYKAKTGPQWGELDTSVSAAISFSFNTLPPKVLSLLSILDYDTIKENRVSRSTNELQKILVHEIPKNGDGDLIFELEEVMDLHDTMAASLNQIKGLKFLTSFGKMDLIELQKSESRENNSVEQSYRSIFQGVGLNPELFSGDGKEAILAAIQKDEAYVFKKVNAIVNFYNLAINNLYSFNPYQLSFSVLPISVYNEDRKVTFYRENASFGIGKLEAVVAAGVKQKDLVDRHRLEEFLQLDEILKPLQSAHTVSRTENGPEPKDNEPKKTEVEVEEEVKTNDET